MDSLIFILTIIIKNRKKKKQASIVTPVKSSSSDYLSNDKSLVENNMVERGGEGNRPPRRTLGDYAYQQGPKHYNSVATYLTTGRRKKIIGVFLSSKKKTSGSRHQHLFKENVRKTKKRSANFEKKRR